MKKKKLLAGVLTLLLSASLSFAQAGTGTQGKTDSSATDKGSDKAKDSKKGKGQKKRNLGRNTSNQARDCLSCGSKSGTTGGTPQSGTPIPK